MPASDAPSLGRRFHLRARLITATTIIGAGLVVAGGGIAMAALGGPREGGLFAYVVAVFTFVAALVGLAIATAPRARALRVLRERHPDHAVFLARRLPAVVSDLPLYLASHGLRLEIGDGWYVADVDGEGIGVWTTGRDPQRLLVIPWSEIGDVHDVRAPTVGGDARWSVTVDVKPYAVPLTVDVGDAWGIVTMALDAADTADVVAAVNARRPQPSA